LSVELEIAYVFGTIKLTRNNAPRQNSIFKPTEYLVIFLKNLYFLLPKKRFLFLGLSVGDGEYQSFSLFTILISLPFRM
jgi:hypothetical protein